MTFKPIQNHLIKLYISNIFGQHSTSQELSFLVHSSVAQLASASDCYDAIGRGECKVTEHLPVDSIARALRATCEWQALHVLPLALAHPNLAGPLKDSSNDYLIHQFHHQAPYRAFPLTEGPREQISRLFFLNISVTVFLLY
jgi:hypothetical protein